VREQVHSPSSSKQEIIQCLFVTRGEQKEFPIRCREAFDLLHARRFDQSSAVHKID